MQKKQAKVFAGLLSMSLAVSLMTPLQGVSGQAARRKIALSKKSVTMTVGQKKTIRIKNAKGKRIKWSIKKKSIASYKKSGKTDRKEKGNNDPYLQGEKWQVEELQV